MKNKLGYTKEWIELGIVTENLITKELKLFNEDPHPEHWRYRNLVKFITDKILFEYSDFDKLLEIIRHDPEKAMISSFCVKLINDFNLTAQQLIDLEHFFKENDQQELFFKEHLKRRLQQDLVSINELEQLLLNDKYHNIIYDNSNNILCLKSLLNVSAFKKLNNKILVKIKEIEKKSLI